VRGQQHHADGRDGSANQARALQAITQPPCGKADREEPQAVLIVGRAPPGGSAGPRSRESLAGPDAAVEAVLRWSQRGSLAPLDLGHRQARGCASGRGESCRNRLRAFDVNVGILSPQFDAIFRTDSMVTPSGFRLVLGQPSRLGRSLWYVSTEICAPPALWHPGPTPFAFPCAPDESASYLVCGIAGPISCIDNNH